jgi:hypothetical protein
VPEVSTHAFIDLCVCHDVTVAEVKPEANFDEKHDPALDTCEIVVLVCFIYINKRQSGEKKVYHNDDRC